MARKISKTQCMNIDQNMFSTCEHFYTDLFSSAASKTNAFPSDTWLFNKLQYLTVYFQLDTQFQIYQSCYGVKSHFSASKVTAIVYMVLDYIIAL